LASLKNGGITEGLDWHRDLSGSATARVPGIQAFVLLDDVSPHGGATLALAGSHRLNGQSRSKQNIDRLLKDNPDSGMAADGVDLFVLEMSGAMGDVYLMDMRLAHTPSINATRHVRLMATVRFFTA
jgi:ectoine hydroxylase-related dioxygenase (phytanoyl-CoA dioxygenase family)